MNACFCVRVFVFSAYANRIVICVRTAINYAFTITRSRKLGDNTQTWGLVAMCLSQRSRLTVSEHALTTTLVQAEDADS